MTQSTGQVVCSIDVSTTLTMFCHAAVVSQQPGTATDVPYGRGSGEAGCFRPGY